ncbi:MAG: hypothetical protein ACI33P_04095 [Lysinibacillus sp.]
MYYYHLPHHQQLPYEHALYHSMPASAPFHPSLLYQPVKQPDSLLARPNPSTPSENRPSFPPVDTGHLNASAIESRKLMVEASKLLDRLATSNDFATKLMEAAQRSDTAEVKRLIRSIGITSLVDVEYNPDGLRLEFKATASGAECCRLLIALRWR